MVRLFFLLLLSSSWPAYLQTIGVKKSQGRGRKCARGGGGCCGLWTLRRRTGIAGSANSRNCWFLGQGLTAICYVSRIDQSDDWRGRDRRFKVNILTRFLIPRILSSFTLRTIFHNCMDQLWQSFQRRNNGIVFFSPPPSSVLWYWKFGEFFQKFSKISRIFNRKKHKFPIFLVRKRQKLWEKLLEEYFEIK
jgi:hypothetical protein